MDYKDVSCAERFKTLESKKTQIMYRAEQAAKLSIPAIFPPTAHTESQALHIPNQGLGAKCVNNLSAKMLLALFPPNTAFFRLDAGLNPENDEDKERAKEITNALAEVEQGVVGHLESTTLRSSMANAFLLDIITGNSLLDIDKDGIIRVFNLRHYVVERDPKGTVIDLIIKEEISPRTLDTELLERHYNASELKKFAEDPDKTVEIYTRQILKDEKYHVYQELNKIKVEDTSATYPKESSRFVVSRWRAVDGEDYGRGLMEEYIGDFSTYDGLCLDMALNSKQAAKVIFTVRANSALTADGIANAESGDVLIGDADDVKTIRVDKNGDFRITYEQSNKLEKSLSEAFLLHSSIQRNAERVTAEEIRYMAQELEDALGGVYSVYGQELQRPLLNRLLKILAKMEVIPPIPEEVSLKITTGLDALGRSHETNKLMSVLRAAMEVLGQEAVMERIRPDAVISELGNGAGVDVEKFLYSQEELDKRQQQQMNQNIAEQSAPGAIEQAIGAMINQNQGA